jgi:hypothetical protein
LSSKSCGTEDCAIEGAERSDPNKVLGDVDDVFTDSTVARANLAISLTKGRAISGDANFKRLK